jgi:putative permease
MRDIASRWMRNFLLLLALGALLWALTFIGGLVKLVLIAALLAYLLDPLAGRIEAYGASRTLATLVVFIIILAMGTLFTLLLLPHVTAELDAARAGIGAGKAEALIHSAEQALITNFPFLGIAEGDIAGKIQEYSRDTGSKVYAYFLNMLAFVTNFLVVIFAMFFFIKDGRDFLKFFVSMIPNQHFEFSLSILHKTNKQLGAYIRGSFLDSLIIGLLTVGAFWVLDVKYFILLGILMGISNLVPFIGPIFATIPPMLVAVAETGDVSKALYVAIACGVVQLIDNAAVKPMVVARMVRLHPVVVLLTVIAGGKFFGVMGMLLSVPAVGMLKVIAETTTYSVRKYRYT